MFFSRYSFREYGRLIDGDIFNKYRGVFDDVVAFLVGGFEALGGMIMK